MIVIIRVNVDHYLLKPNIIVSEKRVDLAWNYQYKYFNVFVTDYKDVKLKLVIFYNMFIFRTGTCY